MGRIAMLAAALAVATALTVHLVTAGGTAARSGRVAIGHLGGAPRGRIVRGRMLLRPRAALAAPASAPLVGNLGPVAAPSRDGRYVAYNTWTWARAIDWHRSLGEQGVAPGDPLGSPRLHLRDLERGNDRAVERGSFSVAWRADGALAYARGSTPSYREGTPFLTDVVVRPHPADEAVVWSDAPARYSVEAWAGRHLLVRRQVDGEAGDVVVFDGPQAMRLLARDADLVAVSPDGAEAVVATSGAQAPAAVALISVADGREQARVELDSVLDPVTKTPVTDVAGIGSWRGDDVVVPSSSGLVVFHAGAGGISVAQVLHVDAAAKIGGGFYEPQLSRDGRTIVTWADVPESGGRQSVQFVCDRYALICEQSAPVPSSSAPRPVYDPSGGER